MRRSYAFCLRQAAEIAGPSRIVQQPVLVRPFASTVLRRARIRPRVVPSAPPQVEERHVKPLPQILESSSAEPSVSQQVEKTISIHEEPDIPEGLPPMLNDGWIDSWTSIGIPEIIARRLLMAFPHIEAPTPAQRAFLLSVFKGKDIYLKDHMGRGKTLAIAVAVTSLAWRSMSKRRDSSRTGHEILVLLPSTHLLHQVERDMLLLDPSFFHPEHPFAPQEDGEKLFALLVGQPRTGKKGAEDTPQRRTKREIPEDMGRAPVVLAIPQDFWPQRRHIDISDVRTVIIDESDTMLPPLPGRHSSGLDDPKSTLNRHPPPLLKTINYILNIKEVSEEPQGRTPEVSHDRGRKTFSQIRNETSGKGRLDFSERRDIQTVWTSGTISSALRRFTKLRGWIRSSQVVDLDFSPDATPRQVEIRNEALRIDGGAELSGRIDERTSDIVRPDPDHYVLTVDATDGGIFSLLPDEQEVHEDLPPTPKGGLQPSLVEALGLVHATSPPPPGTYALAVCPEGVSIDRIQYELSTYGIESLHLRPEVMHDVSALDPDVDGESPIFLTRQSVVPGLHLPHLHTVYLLDGLDVPEGASTVAILERIAFYEIAAGRVGRLGTGSEDGQSPKQRVISIVNQGTLNETVLQDMFFGRFSTKQGSSGTSKGGREKEKRWKLKTWNVGAFKDAINDLARS